MPKLKPLYDAAREADTEVERILSEMTVSFDSGTEEGKQKALELRPALDEAKKAAEDANRLYISARDAEGDDPDTNARKFVPVQDSTSVNGRKEITRAEYERMDYGERHAYLKSGGAIVENPAE